MVRKVTSDKLRLLEQALNGAEASITMARRLLGEVKATEVRSGPSPKILPGVEGTFDGQFMVDADGRKYQVPENYASKSALVYGDRLKMIGEGDEARFKQIERVKRQKAEGILVKKDGKWNAVTADGSYKVLPASVRFYEGEEGDEAKLVLPLKDKHVPFATVEAVVKKEKKVEAKEERVEEKKAPVKKRAPAKKKPTKVVKEEKKEKPAAKKESKKKESPLGEKELR